MIICGYEVSAEGRAIKNADLIFGVLRATILWVAGVLFQKIEEP